MPKARIIERYVFRETLPPFWVSLSVFTMILLVAKITELTDMVVSRGVALSVVGRLLLYALPYFLVFVLPMSTLLAVLLAFLRLGSDREIIAFKSSGVNPARLLGPAGLLALLVWLAASFLSWYGQPWGQQGFSDLVEEIMDTQAELILRQGEFLDVFPGVVIYMGAVREGGYLEDVFILDEREEDEVRTIVAKRGTLASGWAGNLEFTLYDGSISLVDQLLSTAQFSLFRSYDMQLKIPGMTSARRTRWSERNLYPGELGRALAQEPPRSQKGVMVRVEIMRRLALPAGCLVMALLGAALGLISQGGRWWGVLLALVVFVGYYFTLSSAWSRVERGLWPLELGMWLPNLAFTLAGAVLFFMQMKEKRLPFSNLPGRLKRIASSWLRRGGPGGRAASRP